jgi:hypothetical protein
MSRDELKTALSEKFPSKFEAAKPKEWNPRTIRAQLVEAVESNKEDSKLAELAKPLIAHLDTMIVELELGKTKKREAEKQQTKQQNQLQATA